MLVMLVTEVPSYLEVNYLGLKGQYLRQGNQFKPETGTLIKHLYM